MMCLCAAVKAAPPQIVEVQGINVSWSFVSLRSFLKPEFGVQYRSAAQSWKVSTSNSFFDNCLYMISETVASFL